MKYDNSPYNYMSLGHISNSMLIHEHFMSVQLHLSLTPRLTRYLLGLELKGFCHYFG